MMATVIVADLLVHHVFFISVKVKTSFLMKLKEPVPYNGAIKRKTQHLDDLYR
jgi:hypothetical protein